MREEEDREIEALPDIFGLEELKEKAQTILIVGGIALVTVVAILLIKR